MAFTLNNDVSILSVKEFGGGDKDSTYEKHSSDLKKGKVYLFNFRTVTDLEFGR